MGLSQRDSGGSTKGQSGYGLLANPKRITNAPTAYLAVPDNVKNAQVSHGQ
jgi:hypothetical protein